MRWRLRWLWRVITRDPELRPGRRALRYAVLRWSGQLGALIRALETGSYDARPTKLHQCRRDNKCGVEGCDPSVPFKEPLVRGSELKLESLETVLSNVTFDEKHIKTRPWTHADRRDLSIALARGYATSPQNSRSSSRK